MIGFDMSDFYVDRNNFLQVLSKIAIGEGDCIICKDEESFHLITELINRSLNETRSAEEEKI